MRPAFRNLSPANCRRIIVLVLLWTGFQVASSADERTAYPVKSAFREVVQNAAKSTVYVLSDKQRVALGAIVGSDGYVLTKASELTGELSCHLYDGRIVEAELLNADEQWDLALLKIRARDLAVIQWSDDEAPAVGSWLATPGLETIPVSIGVVSVGPRKIERRLPALGIILQDSEQGPKIHRVVEASGADKAGLKPGDLVTQLDGQAVASRDALIEAIRKMRPGDRVRLRVLRGEESLTLEAVLGELNQLVNGERDEFQNSLGGRLSERRAGFPLALQHDTVLRPNQCGGPLVDLEGRAVGVNIARASRVGSYAIPVSAIRPLLEELKTGKMVAATGAN